MSPQTDSLLQALSHRVDALGPDPDHSQQGALVDWIAENFPDLESGLAAYRYAATLTKSEEMRNYLCETADYADPAHAIDPDEDAKP
jgi:hypothetical protein